MEEGVSGENFLALLIVDCMTRFAICTLISDIKALTLVNVILNDWIRPLGKPRRIVMDAGSPGMYGTEWDQFSHAYAIQLVRAPPFAPYQNGLLERVARAMKAGLRAVFTEDNVTPSQRILTQVIIARSHVPHTVTGIPPALAMTGRCDILAGHAATSWTHNPDTVDPAVRQANALGTILTARAAIMAADAERAVTARLHRNLPDRSAEFYPVGDTVQIAHCGESGSGHGESSHIHLST